ncbi:hypothetical protein ACX9NE_09985 [Mycobacterium sp. ML4]
MDDAAAHDWVREGLLIEGLRDWIHLSEMHSLFMWHTGPPRPAHEVQQLTLNMIRELVSEGLFVLGVPRGRRKPQFEAWDLPLDAAMAEIEDAYVTHFDDVWGWRTVCWLDLTEKGKKLALELYHADETESSRSEVEEGS